MNKIILFYKYVDIDDPEAMRDWQKQLCHSLALTGRVLIAQEGINGTLGGSPADIDEYVKIMRKHQLFSDVDFKESFADGPCFPKLKVKVRDTIVNLGIDSKTISAKDSGTHLTPQQTHEFIKNKNQNVVIFDARNAFEARIGKFVEAIVPDIEYFRELPQFIDTNQDLFKDKEVLMYCTGGIRCECASAYLKSKNIAKEVYQIKGGIHRYIEAYPDGYFRGKNYVFVGRIAMKANDDVISACSLCNITCDEYTNCINAVCNKHFTVCSACQERMQNTCSTECFEFLMRDSSHKRTKPAKMAQAVTVCSDSHNNTHNNTR